MKYEGKVVALICAGDEEDRALAIALAEAGARLGIATLHATQQEEFATASIANEVWAIGREQFSHVLDAGDPAAVAAFARLVAERLGHCDELVVSLPAANPVLAVSITAAFAAASPGTIATHALARPPAGHDSAVSPGPPATPAAFVAALKS
jgi:NAD(P)-dependent dehydrogenase (short-subunit alcohol dehydrogenase family)